MPKTVKPFADLTDEYFLIHNYVFDVCMPSLGNAGWRVLCVAIRKTLGWVDKTSPTGRRLSDQISYSQFMAASGLGSPASVSKGIQENLEKEYLLRRQVGTHQGTGAPLYAYQLNRDFEAESPTTESVAGAPDPEMSTTESVVGAATVSVVAATTETVETKVKEIQGAKEKEDLSSDLWPDVLAHLATQVPKDTYNQHLLDSVATQHNGTIRVIPRQASSVPWLHSRLRRTVSLAVAHIAGEPFEVEFVAREEAA